LKIDLTQQLKDAGKNPEPEQIKEASNSLWSDVDLTLKKSSAKSR